MDSFLDFLNRYGLVSMKQGIILVFSLGLVLSTFLISDSYGHGIGYELLPPVNLGNKMVSLEISSSQYNDPLSTDRQISFSLLDIDSSITLRDVTFHVLATKGDNFLFEDTFQSDNGILKMNLIPSESNKISIKKDTQSEGFFQSLIGIKNDVFEIEGSVFKSGGLYQFKVNILTAESYTNQLDEPLMFDVGLSIPDTTYHDIEDPDFGKQQLRVISYYDEIENFRYNHKIRSIEFSMPFEWSKNNVNQTAFIHEEILIPKKFGDLMASSFLSRVNGFELPERVITIDDFLGKNRIIHLIINQNDLKELLENHDKTDVMEFLLKPNSQNLSMLTENGQFRITLGWEPLDIKSNTETTFFFYITDSFLKDKQVAIPYDVFIIYNEKELFNTSGISIESKEEYSKFEYTIPDYVNGPITIEFRNLDGNSYAKGILPLVVNRVYLEGQEVFQGNVSIPKWITTNAGWWAEGTITDDDFVQGIQFLIKNEIMKIPDTNQAQTQLHDEIPSWIKNNAQWWSQGKIDDESFVNGIQFLIENGIMRI